MQEIDEVTIRVLEYVAPVLFKIYMVMKMKLVILNFIFLKRLIFQWETQTYERRKLSKDSKLSIFFHKDYEISPPLLSKSLVFQIYSEVKLGTSAS